MGNEVHVERVGTTVIVRGALENGITTNYVVDRFQFLGKLNGQSPNVTHRRLVVGRMQVRTAFSIVALLLFGGLATATADEPDPGAAETRDSNDPLLKKLLELQADVDRLRQEIRGKAASKPSMSGPTTGRPTVAPATVMPKRPQPPATAKPAVKSTPEPVSQPPQAVANHWSFQPLKRVELPAVADANWVRDELDRFILAKLERAGLRPNPDAGRMTMLRRVAFDLVGLPPTEQEIQAFVGDPGTDEQALARVVDRYLDSPRFGERWGRHWLDVVRYADSVGRTWNAPFTYAWRYRDYVIDALNRDQPYDRFICDQLAGDLLPAGDAAQRREQLTATGFLALGSVDLAPESHEGFILDQIDDQIDATTRALLGLTISCARCHDHKYDPVTMRDYYALAGIFYSTRTLSGQGHKGDLGPGGYVDPDRLQRVPSDPRNSDSSQTLSDQADVHSMSDYHRVWSQGNRNVRYSTDPDFAMGVSEGEVRDSPIRIRGEPFNYGDEVPRGEVRIPGLPQLQPISADESGRLQLARWIASSQNPLTARVMTNRVWQHLFGRGLVRTVDDFGSTGEPPTHPEMLDHLAARFMAEGWSVKKLIHGILLSRTYRQSSALRGDGVAADAQNDLFWRMNRRRLEFEPIRDSLLLAAGRLKFERPKFVPVAGTGGKSAAPRSLLALDSPYRTIYLPVLRSLVPDVYSTFDFSEPSQIKGQREVTTVAPQALFMMNDGLVVDCARDAAERLLDEGSDDSDRVQLAYLRLLGRVPGRNEVEDALQFMAGLDADGERAPRSYRWSALLQALMASGEFRYLK